MSTNLPKELFGIEASEIKKHTPVLHQVVVAQLAAARQGTHKAKTRAEVRGGGRKPFRQKGTGRARQGSTRAPHFTGGGVVHGPIPRDYSQRTPKKLKAFALRLALSDRANAGNVHIIDGFNIKGDTPSTKTALKALNDITNAKSVLVVVSRPVDNKTLEAELLSLRNISRVHLIYVDQINTYDVLLNEAIIFTQSAFDELVSDKVKKESK